MGIALEPYLLSNASSFVYTTKIGRKLLFEIVFA